MEGLRDRKGTLSYEPMSLEFTVLFNTCIKHDMYKTIPAITSH